VPRLPQDPSTPDEGKVAAPEPPEPAPAPVLSAKDKRKLRTLLANARRTLKTKQWKKALRYSNEVLRLDPSNAQATRIHAAAAAKLH